ncbi:MAG: T9SS type A sorting domain-containing protein [Candidatus Latescibacterota bacterium]|jgi:hypothetical protein
MRAIVPALLASWLSICIPASARAQFPPHVWSERFGSDGKTCDEGLAIACDDRGNVFVTGFFEGPVDFGGGTIVGEGFADAFVLKLDAGGAHVWSHGFGSSGQYAKGCGVAAGTDGSVVVTGKFGGEVDFGGGALAARGGSDAFVARYGADGAHEWSVRLGGDDIDEGTGVALDGDGNVLLIGQFRGTADFGGGPVTSAGDHDLFLVKLAANGAHLWSRRYGGALMDLGRAVAVDSWGNVYATGSFQGAVDFGGGALASAGYHDVFVLKLDAGGNHVWSRRAGGAVNDYGNGIAVGSGGDVLLTGEFRGTVDFGGGPLTSAGNEDVFVVRYDTGGEHLWSRRFGDPYFAQSGFDVASGADGGVVVAGWFWGTIDLGGGTMVSAGEKDAFVAGYDRFGTHLWSGRFGDAGWDAGFGVDTDGAGNTAVAGAFEVSIDFGGGTLVNPGGPSFGCTDAFAARFGPLSVWLDGPDRLASGRPGLFTATMSGGEAPFTYRWYKAAVCDAVQWQEIGGDDTRVSASSRTDFCIKCELSDGAGGSASRTHHVEVTSEKVDPLRRTAKYSAGFVLDQNVPNPFNPDTRIRFELPIDARVLLAVYDVDGREVARLVDGAMGAGPHAVTFEAEHLPSGIYFYRMRFGTATRTRKMVLLK